MRTIGAVQATHTVVAPYEPIRVIAERAVVAALASVAGNTPRIGRTLTQLPYEITEPRLELSRTELLDVVTHEISFGLGTYYPTKVGSSVTGSGVFTHFFESTQAL